MTDFFHDPTDDHDDDITVTLQGGFTLRLCPSCLTVLDRTEQGPPVARLPLNLDHILGVAGGEALTAHATHRQTLTVEREPGGLRISVCTPHVMLRQHHLALPVRAV